MLHPGKPIDSPAAWIGKEMAACETRWLTHWSHEEIGELEETATRYLERGNDVGAITAANFPLPHLSTRLRRLRNTLLHGVSFELIRGLPVASYSIEMVAAIFCGIGAHLGSPRSQNAMGHILGHVKDIGVDPNDPDSRIYQTRERQTFHTDSCDVVGLLCLKEAMKGGQSLLVSTVTLYNEMLKRRSDLVPLLFDPVATDRRGEVPEGERPYFEIPVLNWYRGFLTGIYHRPYIEAAQRFPDTIPFSDDYVEALDLLDALANDPRLHLSMRLQPGDMQFVYNHAVLHDRTRFKDWPEPDKRRHLLRLWLSIPGDRPLPAVFAQRYGSVEIGNRGGIITKDTRLNAPLAP